MILYRLIRCALFHLRVLDLLQECVGVSAVSELRRYRLLCKLFDVYAASVVLNLVAEALAAAGADVSYLELAEAHS